jgi:hypothetical protein
LQAQYNKPQRDKSSGEKRNQRKPCTKKASHIGNRTKEREGTRTHKRCLSSLQTHSKQSNGLGAPVAKQGKTKGKEVRRRKRVVTVVAL